MGNVQGTSQKNREKLKDTIDFIATDYILSQNFNELKHLSDPSYCNQLVILTSDIINNKLDVLDVTYLTQELRKGDRVSEREKNRIMYIKKDNLDDLEC